MDRQVRELERRWQAGDPAALSPLQRAQCRALGHEFGDWSWGFDVAQEYANSMQANFQIYRECTRCGHKIRKIFKPEPSTDSTGSITWSITTSDSSSNLSWASTTVSYDYDDDDDEDLGPVGTRYYHPTKKRAWAKRAFLSKRELKRRRRQRRAHN